MLAAEGEELCQYSGRSSSLSQRVWLNPRKWLCLLGWPRYLSLWYRRSVCFSSYVHTCIWIMSNNFSLTFLVKGSLDPQIVRLPFRLFNRKVSVLAGHAMHLSWSCLCPKDCFIIINWLLLPNPFLIFTWSDISCYQLCY